VLQALRAHDDRFNATVNQIELNKQRPDAIQVIGVGGGSPAKTAATATASPRCARCRARSRSRSWRNGRTPSSPRSSSSAATAATGRAGPRTSPRSPSATPRASSLLEKPRSAKGKKAFDDFLKGLRKNLNPSISQRTPSRCWHSTSSPPGVRCALRGLRLHQQEPVSQSMQKMLDILEDQALDKGAPRRCKGSTPACASAPASTTPRGARRSSSSCTTSSSAPPSPHGRAARHRVHAGRGRGLHHAQREDVPCARVRHPPRDKNVHIIDPFTGTGTFIVRLLQSGLIPQPTCPTSTATSCTPTRSCCWPTTSPPSTSKSRSTGLTRSGARNRGRLRPVRGHRADRHVPALESKGEMEEKMFPENNRRVKRQKQSPIRVVIGNPPYSTDVACRLRHQWLLH
jgi:hypothetical protein